MCKVIVFTAALALLTGCAVGPDYQIPATSEPQAFSGGKDILAGRTDQQRFWKGFDDPLLEQLIAQTLTSNLTLEEALARYERAAALLYGAERDQWPSLTTSASATEQHLADIEQSPPGAGPERAQRFQAGVVASWELDLFGRLRRATEAQRAELEATGADLGAMQVALAGQLTNSYFELRGLQQQYQVAHRNLALQQQSLDIVEARVDAGRGTEFDKARAQVQLERTRAELPALQADIRAAMHRIAVLTGQPPLALVEQLSAQSGLPEVVPMIPVDTPGEVLRRRPDIAAAERRLAAATARIGVATADSGDLFTGSAESRRVALGIDWTFLDHNRVKARIDAAGADNRAALASYQQTVLEALEEVETRLVRYQRAQQRDDRLAQAMNNAEKAVDLAHARYEEGFIGYFEVLTTEQEYVSTRDAAVRSRTEVTLAMVDVYRSLMGAPDTAATALLDTL